MTLLFKQFDELFAQSWKCIQAFGCIVYWNENFSKMPRCEAESIWRAKARKKQNKNNYKRSTYFQTYIHTAAICKSVCVCVLVKTVTSDEAQDYHTMALLCHQANNQPTDRRPTCVRIMQAKRKIRATKWKKIHKTKLKLKRKRYQRRSQTLIYRANGWTCQTAALWALLAERWGVRCRKRVWTKASPILSIMTIITTTTTTYLAY